MSYIPVTLNHFRAVKAWADSCDAQVDLDVRTFNLEVKLRNRYYTLKPRFLVVNQGRVAYATSLVKDVTGFIGWLPYEVLQWDLSQDKLLFKKFLESASLKFPATWSSLEDVDGDFLVKLSNGSFGYQIAGPHRQSESRAVTLVRDEGPDKKGGNLKFAEQFITGTNLKVWYWGAKAFYAHVHPYPTIVGDGVSTVQALVDVRLARAGEKAWTPDEEGNLKASLAFQQARPADVPEQGREIWIDFRYGRQYKPSSTSADTDNDLGGINEQVRRQIDLAGVKAAEAAMRRFKAPVLYSIDGVVDEEGAVWWLEINSNPILPPDGYPLVFASLFGPAKKP